MIDPLSNWLLETLIATSVLLAFVLVIRKPVARYFGANAAYLLWLAPIARIFLPELRIIPATDTLPAPHSPIDIITYDAIAFGPIDGSALNPLANLSQGSLFNIGSMALCIWIIGMAIALSRHIVAHRLYNKSVIATSRPATPSLDREFDQVRKSLKLPPKIAVRLSTGSTGPLVVGLFKPVIIMPSDFKTKYTLSERALAFSHEANHIKRGDLTSLFVAIIFKSTFWFNPLVYIGFNAFRIDQEAACDASVLRQHKNSRATTTTYANAILKSANTSSMSRQIPITSLAMSHPIKERITLMTNRRAIAHPMSHIAAIALIATSLAATASYSHAANQDKVVIIEHSDDGKKNSKRKSVITVDGDNEELEIDGFDGQKVHKVVYVDDNGKRSLKAYTRKGKKVLDKKYDVGEDMPYSGVRAFEDGEETSYVSFADGGGFKLSEQFVVPHPPEAPHSLMINADCATHETGTHGTKIIAIQTDDHEKVVVQEVICDEDIDEDASPEKRASALRKAIETLERDAERAQARREKAIERLKERLKEIE